MVRAMGRMPESEESSDDVSGRHTGGDCQEKITIKVMRGLLYFVEECTPVHESMI